MTCYFEGMHIMYRRINPPDETEWVNPFIDDNIERRPALGEITFPSDSSTVTGKRLQNTVEKLYCDNRRNKDKDIVYLKLYINNPQTNIFIIWGDVGIGKSYYVRHQMTKIRESSLGVENIYGDVIDMLRGGAASVALAVYPQLCDILERYFNKAHDSTWQAAMQYSIHQAEVRYGNMGTREKIRLAAESIVSKSMTSQVGEEYALYLMRVLEYVTDANLFITVDNIDRLPSQEQSKLLGIAVQLLNHPRIKLIIPLRKSSSLIGDRYKELQQVNFEEMELSPLILADMVHKRYKYDVNGKSLQNTTITDKVYTKNKKIQEKEYIQQYSYEDIYHLMFQDSENGTGALINQLAAPNARVFLSMLRQIMKSDQLEGLHNLDKREYIIAALMLSNQSEADPYDTYILNLFENGLPNVYGNNLIRFRVLEYFKNNGVISPNDVKFQKHFNILEYPLEDVVRIIALFVGRGILVSSKGLVPEQITSLQMDAIGPYSITTAGSVYFEILIPSQWYYVAVKRGILLSDKYIRRDKDQGHEYVTHSGLVEFLSSQEEVEKARRRANEKVCGQIQMNLKMPSALARNALNKGKNAQQ